MTTGRAQVAASILTADFGNLYRVVRKLERAGVDRLHLDVMDGHFVPNLTFGHDVVAAFRRLTSMPLDVHLMISHPSRYIERFIEAGGDSFTFHVECDEPDEIKADTLRVIREAGRSPGLAVSPGTSVAAVEPFLPLLDIIMI
ncbi:MAG: ribulose-phosphate 3-epimerase, partial [Chloroflexi bacterium]|nr:ribulose-phosphate 3-epimerase [Chloroflexota bacterium]